MNTHQPNMGSKSDLDLEQTLAPSQNFSPPSRDDPGWQPAAGASSTTAGSTTGRLVQNMGTIFFGRRTTSDANGVSHQVGTGNDDEYDAQYNVESSLIVGSGDAPPPSPSKREDEQEHFDHFLGGLAESKRTSQRQDQKDEKNLSGTSSTNGTIRSIRNSMGITDLETTSPFASKLTFGFGTGMLWWCLLLFILAFAVPAALMDFKVFQHLLKDAPLALFDFIAVSASVVPSLIFMTWAAQRVLSLSSPSTTKRVWSWAVGRTGLLMLLSVAVDVLGTACLRIVTEEYHPTVKYMINHALAFILFSFWISILDDAAEQVQGFADSVEQIAESSPKTAKWKGFMTDLAKYKNPVIDKAYAVPGGSRSPARVLGDVIGVYLTLGKMVGFIFLFLFMVGVNLYSNLVTFGLSAMFLSVISALHINDALSNLMPLAISNTFHLGEIVALASPSGSNPGNNPSTVLTGFVEGITWSHVVIRDFGRRQVFVPHRQMTDLNIYNWSRRPSKSLHISVNVKCSQGGGATRVATLVKFVKEWIKGHDKIDLENYIKVRFKMNQDGTTQLQIYCYPKVGENKALIGAEMSVMILEAAKRLDLCLTPLYYKPDRLWNVTPGDFTGVNDEDSPGTIGVMEKGEAASISTSKEEEDHTATTLPSVQQHELALLSDLMPSERLRKVAGFGDEKKKKE